MKIALDRKHVYVIIFIFTCLSIGTAILRNGWYMTWTTLRVRSMTPPFADMRTVQGALLSAKQGLNPQINNPGDPWHRVMNYPKIWLWIATLFQLDHETNYLVFICTYILAYLVCCVFLLRHAPSLYLLLAMFSWASLLAVERGNNDVLAFVVLFAGISLSQRYLRAFSIVLATVLKIYPAVVALTFAKRRKILIPLLVLIAGYVLSNLDELKILQAGNTAWSDPASLIASYGLDTNLRVLHYITLRSTTSLVLKSMLILVSVVLSALISRTKYLNLTNPSPYNTDLFLAGGLVFSCTYLLTSNWDYRLIFLLLCIPFILSIQSRVVRHSMLIGILLSSNVSLLWEYFGQSGMMLWTLSQYYLFVMVTAYLVREFTQYFSGIPWLQAHHLSNIAHRVPKEST